MKPENPLPENRIPRVSISHSSSPISKEISAIWEYRELLFFLALRDIKIRYSNTAFGLIWVLLKPLLTVAVFTLLFSQVIGVDSTEIPYPLFVFAGVAPWFFFSNTVNNCGNSLIGNSNLITKVYFPRLIIPAATLVAGLLDFLITLAFLSFLMLHFNIRPGYGLMLLPLIVLITALLALGVGILTSALTVKYRDLQLALPFMLQILMFITPVIYPSSRAPLILAKVIYLNPLTGIIDGFRSVICGYPLSVPSLLMSTLIALIFIFIGTWYFRYTEDTIADVI